MTGESRFEILRTLGEGGMGVVYLARDRARDMMVALKSLRSRDANLLYHFKNEFRSLADLKHANLVTLYELFEVDGNWFFTMEVVEGCEFTDWICPPSRRSSPALIGPTMPAAATPPLKRHAGDAGTMLEYVATVPPAAATPAPAFAGGTSEAIDVPFDEARLRAALAQLAAGLNALHGAGKVHRDIKPSNILVTPDGRVVIMDFGLIADATLLAEFAASRVVAGTPLFMAPEQGIPGASVGASADWYAVGVMLYQVLTNRMPFDGTTVQDILAAKRTPPPAPSRVAAGVPPDLAELCERLMAPDPAARPDGDEVIRILGGKARSRRPVAQGDVFVGRRAELGLLHSALAESRSQAVAVFVEGTSGLGKTALVKRFLDEVAGTGTMVLLGRCYAEESVPYKAFDGIVDALSRNLVTMDPVRARELVPSEAALAARLFPVLRRVPYFADQGAEIMASAELRGRAFAGLVEVLRRVGASQPLLLFVDDLQWADADSMLLLRELLHQSHAPLAAFVASVRTADGADTGGDLARSARIEPRRMKLEPLAAGDAALLMDRLLPRDAATAERRREIEREAAGHPLFLAELALHAAHGGASASSARLDDALWDRALALDGESRHLLEIVAVAGTPIDPKVAAEACGLSPTKCAPLLAALRTERFIKVAATIAGDAIEPYHDRVRESVVTRMGRDEFASASARLANALLHAGIGESQPELVVRHLFAAGDSVRGRDLAERAAARALGALAFDRAAEFLRAALVAGPRDAAHGRALHTALAEALASAGRGAEAADAYLAAGAIAGTDEKSQLDYRRRAADQLLASGHVERGLGELRQVLAVLGERIPATPEEALASLEAERAAIDSHPIAFVARTPPPDLARRHDVYQSTSLGLILVDNVRGADFQVRATRTAIASGDPRRAVRALVFEAIYRAQEGEVGRHRALELTAAAADIARGRGDSWMDAYLVLAGAFHAYYCGRFRQAVEQFKVCDACFRALPGVAWEQNTIRLHRLRATDYQGAWGELRALYDEYLRDAQRRDDRYVEASITRWFNVLWLAHDRPDLAGADLDKSRWQPPEPGRYHLQHFLELRARVELAFYRGDGAAQGVWARPGLDAADRSLLLRIQIARAIADWLLGRIAACEGDLPEVLRRAHMLVEQRVPYAAVWSGLLVAAAVAQRGDRAGAVSRLEATAAFADDHDFPLCAAIARLRAGQLLGDAAGAVAIARASAWMTAQDIRNPIRMCDVFAPGFGV